MTQLLNSPVYVFLFISIYFEVFLLVTYFEKRHLIKHEDIKTKRGPKKFPSVTIIVPCWNEEDTISKTIHSLLNLDYPKNKLKIIIVDDGSTDNTWDVIKKFENKEQIEIHHKENGGKYTALNYGLSKTTTELVGCLDADSYVNKDTLKNIVIYFEDKETMAVTPSVRVWKPKTIIQLIQKVEYTWGILFRKILSYVGALYVTPGPFSIFRVEVFQNLGGYRHAHQTEDMELAIRMQSNHYKITNAHNAEVYTVAPPTLKKLYKQKLRWSYGFIKNAIDYKYMIFNKKYGNLGIFVFPMAILSMFSTLYVVSLSVFGLINSLMSFLVRIEAIGLHWTKINFDWFYINTQFVSIASVIAFIGTLTILMISRKLTDGKFSVGMDLFYFLTLYAIIAPLWIGKALYNAIFSIKTHWR